MTATLDGRSALVTGGSRGIGEAVVLRLASEGADVAFTYRDNAERAATVADRVKALGRRVLTVQADSADPALAYRAVDVAAAEFGRLDILVNNAGFGHMGPFSDVTVAEFDEIVAVNVRAPFVAAQAAARHLRAGGRIVNVGSCVSDRVPFPGMSLYALSKTALTGMTKGLARELGPRGITVNEVHPGPIDTEMNPADGPGADAQSGLTAIGRYGRPDEVAAMVAYLAGDDAGYVTGTAVAVDGGHAA